MNYTHLTKIRKRILKIIAQFFENQFSEDLQDYSCQQNKYALDESKIEEWCDMLYSMIMRKKQKIKPLNIKDQKIKNYKQIANNKKNLNSLNNKLEQPSPNMFPSKYLIQFQNDKKNKQTDKLLIHTAFPPQNINLNKVSLINQIKLKNTLIKSYQCKFPKRIFAKYSSWCPVSDIQYIVSGGILYDGQEKTNRIYKVIIEQKSQLSPIMQKLGELLDPISSHASVYLEPYVYFIGGKKQEGIITRQCSKINILSQNTLIQEIAALNYGAASLSVTSWKNQYIYKIGGQGQSFQCIQASPFIQRYNVKTDTWQIINPLMPNDCLDFELSINSFAYECTNGIIILGGFNFQKEPNNKYFKLAIADNDINGETNLQVDSQLGIAKLNQNIDHQIECFEQIAQINAGGFSQNNGILIHQKSQQTNIITIQRILRNQQKNRKLEKRFSLFCFKYNN